MIKIAVDCAREMIEREKLIILYQFIDVISAKVLISQDEFKREYGGISWDDFTDILDSEIINLLRQRFEEPIEKDTGLKSYLKGKDVPEEWQEKIIKLKLEKCKYVDKFLGGEREKIRYSLKNRSLFKKLSNIDCELSRTIDEEELLYAIIKMSVDAILEGRDMPRAVRDMLDKSKENITFICDRSDIESVA